MLETLKNIDSELLLFFNHLNNNILDFLFYWISDKWIWVPFYLFLAWQLIKKYKIDFFWVMIFIAFAITASDQIASTIIKERVMRLRPCHEPSIMAQVHLVNGYCGGKYGFISSHAANTFALAAFLIRIIPDCFKGFAKVISLWAVMVSFSRIYLGVHYPADVVVAALMGIVIGTLIAKLCVAVISRYSLVKKEKR